MVYKLTFPAKLTEEECMLQAKYAVLRKKKKALEQVNAAGKKVVVGVPTGRAVDPKFAKLMACRKVQQGRIGVGKAVALPAPKTGGKASYKRPSCTQKIISTGLTNEGQAPSFGPFKPTPIQAGGSGVGGRVAHRPRVYPSSPSFAFGVSEGQEFSSSAGGYRGQNSSSSSTVFRNYESHYAPSNVGADAEVEDNDYFGRSCNKRTRGPTIFVSGQKLTEQGLTEAFRKYGRILQISLPNPIFGFITYSSEESAKQAIRGMDDKTVDQVTYKVEFADHQPTLNERLTDASASDSWSTLATNGFPKRHMEDSRQQVVYDQDEDAVQV